jgi:hypothetical protein
MPATVRRLLRILPNAAAAGSLVLCVATVALWVRGARREPGVRGAYVSGAAFYAQATTHKHVLSFDLVAGTHWPRMRAAHYPTLGPGFGVVRRGEYGRHPGDLPPLPLNAAFSGVSVSGAMWLRTAPAVRVRVVTVAVHHWLILIGSAVSAVGFRKVATRRPKPGLCPACGYELRATPDRCPECGRVAAAAASEVTRQVARPGLFRGGGYATGRAEDTRRG